MKSFFLALIMLLPLYGYSQAVAIKKVLATAQTEHSVSMQKDQAGMMKSAYSGLPLIRDLEFRVRNDEFIDEYVRYNLRITPKGFGEDRALRKLFKAEKQLVDQEVQLRIHNALMLRYAAIIEFLANQRMNQLYTEMILVLEDRIKVLEKNKFATDFDLQNIIDAENNLTKVKDQNIQSAKDQMNYMWQIRQFLSDTGFIGFDTAGLVQVETISERVKTASIGTDTDNVYLNNYRLKFLVSEGKYNAEKAQDRRYLSLLSFTYDYGAFIDENGKRLRGRPYDQNAQYSLEFGFRLPFLSADGRDVALRRSQFLADRTEYDLAKQELVYKTERDIKDVGALITHYRYLLARQNEVNAEGSLQKYLKMSGVDPLMLLSIKEGLVQNGLRIEKTRFDILRNYLQVLDETGQLSRMPLVNYLSASKEAVAP